MSTSKLESREDKDGKHLIGDLRPSRTEAKSEVKKMTLFKAAKFAIAKSHVSTSKISA